MNAAVEIQDIDLTPAATLAVDVLTDESDARDYVERNIRRDEHGYYITYAVPCELSVSGIKTYEVSADAENYPDAVDELEDYAVIYLEGGESFPI